MSDFQKIMNTLLVFPFCCMFVIVPLQWGEVTAGDYTLPISFTSNYSVAANDIGAANASIKISKKTNSIVNFYGKDYNGGIYASPSVCFIAVGV